MLLSDFDFSQGLRVRRAHLFRLGRLILILGQTESIGLQKFRSLILQIRRRFNPHCS
jgi:hypothetical protein